MKYENYLCRLPFHGINGNNKYCVMGEMTDDPDETLRIPIKIPAVIRELPFCVDCFGELDWAELLYGVGARQCMQCGSVFQIISVQDC